MLDRPHEAQLDRWTARLREDTGAAAAAFVLVDATRMFIKSLSTADGGWENGYGGTSFVAPQMNGVSALVRPGAFTTEHG